MERIFGMMPNEEIEKEQNYLTKNDLIITIQAGPHGYAILYADGASRYKDVDATTEENFNKAYEIAVDELGTLELFIITGETAGEICETSKIANSDDLITFSNIDADTIIAGDIINATSDDNMDSYHRIAGFEPLALGSTKFTTVYCEDEDHYQYNGPHEFIIMPSDDKITGDKFLAHIKFQKGPVKECSLNGIFHEDLIVILIKRLMEFQKSAFACEENEEAISHLQSALECLNRRTSRRNASGVLGTNNTDASEQDYVRYKL